MAVVFVRGEFPLFAVRSRVLHNLPERCITDVLRNRSGDVSHQGGRAEVIAVIPEYSWCRGGCLYGTNVRAVRKEVPCLLRAVGVELLGGKGRRCHAPGLRGNAGTRGIVAVGDVFVELLPAAASPSRRHGPEPAALARVRDFGETVIVVPGVGD